MKLIFTAALAASLLCGTAAMAQPGDNNRDRRAEQADRQADRKAQKSEDKRDNRGRDQAVGAPRALNAPQMAAPDRAADSRQQGRGERNGPSAQINQPAPVATAPAAPVQAARDASPYADRQGRGDRNGPDVRTSQPAPAPSAAPNQVVRDASPYTRRQADRMQAQQPGPAPQYQDRQQQAPQYQTQQYQTRNPANTGRGDTRTQANRWSRGDRLPDQYRQDRYYVNDWQQHGLRQPPGGYRWVRDDSNDFYLSLIATGVIADTVYRSDRDDRWRQRYSRYYSYNDDVYYQECRRSPDPAGILVGGLIGGLLGNSAGRGGNRTGTTIAGVIVGGAVGAALTRNMGCEDRSYAYRTYYNGFNSGRPGSYQWRNPRNDNRGEFRIGRYYNDPYGFRCARFNQVTYIQGRAYRANGVACRQPDGSWTIVS
jgi:Ni/Co efflux regulator RcnB/surface antigen